ncbi:hypothetical protein [Vallitalea guaymasensis]|uniref:hypothetical protein n=1 Tax=Vallitalea guaymasensis TaxID=1185412 RepID=UPI000DE2CA7B|nr:hypothetical protein [Vallitalea guaymasensis]
MKRDTKLLLVLTVICISFIFVFNLMNRQHTSKAAFEEAVDFGKYSDSIFIPFDVKRDSILKFECSASVEQGNITIQIINKGNEILYTKSGSNYEDSVDVKIPEGLWYCNIIINNSNSPDDMAEKGTYSVYGKLK